MTRAAAVQIAAAAAVVLVFAAVLPIRVEDAAKRSSTEECLTLSAKAPAHESDATIAAYVRCLDIEPRDAVLMRDLGTLYEEAGDAPRAEEMYRRALAVDAGYADVHTRLGWLLLRKGDKAGARAEADRAVALTLNASSARELRKAAQ